MKDTIDKSLSLWGLSDAKVAFIAGRENQVYRVDGPRGSYALRIKRPGYRKDAELVSELDWMAAMHDAGLSVPRPAPSASGKLLEIVDGQRVDALHWLNGHPIGKTRVPLELEDIPSTFHRIGQTMAKLHEACDAWVQPANFDRWHWDSDGLTGDNPVWGRYWDNPTLDPKTRSLFIEFRQHARSKLSAVCRRTRLRSDPCRYGPREHHAGWR